MGPMNSFFTIPALGGYEEQFEEIIDEIYDAASIRIVAPATLDGVVSMALIEASLIDVGKNFTRRFVGSRHQIPRDEDQFKQKPFNGLSIFLDVESEHVPADQLLIDSSIIRLKPIEAEVEFFRVARLLHGGKQQGAQGNDGDPGCACERGEESTGKQADNGQPRRHPAHQRAGHSDQPARGPALPAPSPVHPSCDACRRLTRA